MKTKSLSTYVRKGSFYKSVAEDGSDIIFIVDYEGNILYHNNSVREILGYHASSLVGKNFFNFIPPILLSDFKKAFKNSTKKRFNKSIEFQFLAKDKTYKHLEFNSVNLKQREQIEGLILDCRDISQRKKDAEELMRAQKAKEQFLANISHEIRTPINGIAGMASLLSQNPTKEEQHTYLRAIRSAADNLKVIINDILDLASIESGKLQFEKIGFNLNDLLLSLIDAYGVQASEKGVKLSYTLADDANKVFIGDPVRLNQILINLISNAIKFTHAGSIHVLVKIDKLKEELYKLRFDITDTGIGIPKAKLQTIFESFSKADKATLEMVDHHTITVLTKADQGIQLPVDGYPVSVISGQGMEDFLKVLTHKTRDMLSGDRAGPVLTRQRHRAALEDASIAFTRALQAPLPELAAEDMRLALRALGRITGRVHVEELLDKIFRDFCIGK